MCRRLPTRFVSLPAERLLRSAAAAAGVTTPTRQHSLGCESEPVVMPESRLIFECCDFVSDIYMQCRAIKPHSKYRRMMETHTKYSITFVLYGAGSTLVNIFQWTGGSRKKVLQRFQAFSRPFCEHYLKNGNKDVLCELILG